MRYSENFQGLFSCQTQAIVYKRGIVALISLLGRKSINGGFRHLTPDFTHDFGVLNRI